MNGLQAVVRANHTAAERNHRRRKIGMKLAQGRNLENVAVKNAPSVVNGCYKSHVVQTAFLGRQWSASCQATW